MRTVRERTGDRRAVPVAVVSPLVPVGDLTSDATISTATVITNPGGSFVRLEASTQNIRYTLDGTTPTATVGFLLAKDTPTDFYLGEGAVLTVIEVAATGTIQYQWFK